MLLKMVFHDWDTDVKVSFDIHVFPVCRSDLARAVLMLPV